MSLTQKNQKPTLLILAAGMGSRYGGLKQIDPVGPSGEIIIDYSMYDAVAAGFGKIVFVIRKHFEEAFKEKIGSKLDGKIDVVYAFQELDSCLDGFALPADREKPWGTGHAILVAKDVINEPFAVINADDYYGRSSLAMISDYLDKTESDTKNEYAMVGYKLANTLSAHGTVCRGICRLTDDMMLKSVAEHTEIANTPEGVFGFDSAGARRHFTGDEFVSMNLWGFRPSIFKHLLGQFRQFLSSHGRELKSEFFIPSVVDNIINRGQGNVRVLGTDDSWFGVTYRSDRKIAEKCIAGLIDRGVYPRKLW